MLPFDYERDRDSVLRDLESGDEELRRLAVERIDVLDEHEILPRLVERLGDPDWRVRKAAVARIVVQLDPAETSLKLIEALADGENPGRRNAAVEALVTLGGAAIATLVAACTHPDPDVRKFVVDAMAGIGDERAAPALIGRLEDTDANVRAAAADALGAIGGSQACRALRETAQSPLQDALVRFSALHALDTLEVTLRADELAPVLGDPMLGPAALALLGRCEDDPSALEALLKGLTSEVRATRESSIRSLLRLASRQDDTAIDTLVERIRETARSTPRVVDAAIERLADADLGTQLALIQFLGLVGAPSAVVPILEAGRDEALAQVALGALEGMGALAVEMLEAGWAALAVERRRDACAVLGRTGGTRAIARLVATLEDADPALRGAAARALGALRAEGALAALVRRLELAGLEDEHQEEGERAAITEALTLLAGPDEDGNSPAVAARAVELLAGRLAGCDDQARLSIARVLGCIARRDDAALISLLLKDPSAEVRRAAVDAIARIEPDRTPEPLHLAIADESPEVRIAAARALGTSRCGAVFEDLRRLTEDDDARVRATAVRAVGRRFGADPAPEVRAGALAVLNRACGDDALVALAVVEAVRDVGGEAASYVTPLLSRSEPEVVREAVRCFGRHAEQSDLETLLPLVSHSDWSVRAEVIEILSERGVERAVPAILRRLEMEQDDFVRKVSLAALHRLEG